MNRQYEVTVFVEQLDDDGVVFSSERVGSYRTWAGSPAQARNNIRFRLNLRDTYGSGGYSRRYRMEVIEVDNNRRHT